MADNRRIVNEVNQRGTGGAACRRENGTAQISQYPAISDRSFYFPKVALHQSFVERTSRTRKREREKEGTGDGEGSRDEEKFVGQRCNRPHGDRRT